MTAVVAKPVTPADPAERTYEVGWWGMVLLIATEATVFAALLSAYFFLRATSDTWPQGGIRPPELFRISLFTALLIGSSIPLFYAEVAIRRGRVVALQRGLLISFLMGLAFVVNQAFEFNALEFRPSDNAYASLFVVITGLHGLHLVVGLLMSLVVQLKARLGRFDADHHLTVSVFSLYWHFVDGVWIFVFTSLYVAVHLR